MAATAKHKCYSRACVQRRMCLEPLVRWNLIKNDACTIVLCSMFGVSILLCLPCLANDVQPILLIAYIGCCFVSFCFSLFLRFFACVFAICLRFGPVFQLHNILIYRFISMTSLNAINRISLAPMRKTIDDI